MTNEQKTLPPEAMTLYKEERRMKERHPDFSYDYIVFSDFRINSLYVAVFYVICLGTYLFLNMYLNFNYQLDILNVGILSSVSIWLYIRQSKNNENDKFLIAGNSNKLLIVRYIMTQTGYENVEYGLFSSFKLPTYRVKSMEEKIYNLNSVDADIEGSIIKTIKIDFKNPSEKNLTLWTWWYNVKS